MTAINLITIIFSVISVLTRFVGECSICLGPLRLPLMHSLPTMAARCMTLMEDAEMAIRAIRRPHSAARRRCRDTFFCSRK